MKKLFEGAMKAGIHTISANAPLAHELFAIRYARPASCVN
tara:strand:- start:11972 stop:12091 length:120 start_codon:yes stop_codon:yes gene_type:complete